jgi:hypothetical protein
VSGLVRAAHLANGGKAGNLNYVCTLYPGGTCPKIVPWVPKPEIVPNPVYIRSFLYIYTCDKVYKLMTEIKNN